MSTQSQSVVLITGASNGLGKALAIVYAKFGHHLLLTGRNAQSLAATTKEAEVFGVKVYSLALDLEKPEAIETIMAFITAQHLDISILINNAGLGSHINFGHLPEGEIQSVLTVNIQALVLLTHKVVPLMMHKKQGHIVNIASVYSFASIPGQVLYSATKAFVKSFSVGLSIDLSRYGIKVSCVCPGSTTDTKFRSRIGLQINTKRFSAPANLVAEKIYAALQKKPRIYIPLWYNKVFVFLMQCLPAVMMANVGAFIVYRLRKIKEISRE